jgi:hypothetical protein
MVTLEEEKRFIILTATLLCGGKGTKAKILDKIDQEGLIKLTEEDRRPKHNRDEVRWRNDLAFIRKHLVISGYLDGSVKNRWMVTNTGRQYHSDIFKKVKLEKNSSE